MANKCKPQFCRYCGSHLEKYYSIETAAQLLDCSKQALRNWVRDRKIGFVKFGRMVRIPESEIVKKRKFFPTLKEQVEKMLIG